MSTTVHHPLAGGDSARQAPSHFTAMHRLVAIVVVLAAAVVALGTWVAIERTGGGAGEEQALADDLTKAWSTYDGDALASVYATGAVIRDLDGNVTEGIDAIRGVASIWKLQGIQVERIADVSVNGEYVTTFVRFTTPSGDQRVSTGEVMTLLQVRDGKIVRHWDFAPGTTAPLGNALRG